MSVISIKYAAFLTGDNTDGTDMVVSGPSDTAGGVDTVTVSQGDIVGGIEIDGGGNVTVTLWEVVDGDPWLQGSTLSPGNILVVVGTGIPYQKGLAAVILEDGTLGTVNLPIIFELTGT